MSAPTYSLDPKHVEDVKNSILGAGTKIRTELTTMDNNLQQYMADWQGLDQTAYTEYKTKWNGLINEMNDTILPKAAGALGNMLDNVLGTELVNRKMW